MMTAQAVFENMCKTKRSSELLELQAKVKADHENAFGVLTSSYKQDNVDKLYEVLDTLNTSEEKIKAVKAFENCKDQEGYLKSLPKLIEKQQTEEEKERLASGSTAGGGV